MPGGLRLRGSRGSGKQPVVAARRLHVCNCTEERAGRGEARNRKPSASERAASPECCVRPAHCGLAGRRDRASPSRCQATGHLLSVAAGALLPSHLPVCPQEKTPALRNLPVPRQGHLRDCQGNLNNVPRHCTALPAHGTISGGTCRAGGPSGFGRTGCPDFAPWPYG